MGCTMVPLCINSCTTIRVRLFITGLLFIISANVYAQKHYNFFYGTVLDEEKRAGISYVNFSFIGSHLGAVSDKKGEFSFFIDTLPVTMLVSHIGYVTKKIFLDTTSYSLTIYLAPLVTLLKEVEIKASVHEAFFKDDQYAIKDYEIDSGYVYLLIYRYQLSHMELVCKNLEGDTIARTNILPYSPKGLIKDCLGFLHVFNRDSIFQIYREEGNIFLIHGESMEKYEKILSNCLASTYDVLYFKKQTDLGMGIEYYGINRISRERQVLSTVRDEKKAKMLRRNPQDASLLLSGIPEGRETFVEWNWVHKILYRPLGSALYKIGKFICIFNIPDKQIEFYDQKGAYSYKLALQTEFHPDGRWSNEIFVDEVRSKAYTALIKNGYYMLFEINLNTGELKKALSIFHPYPEKIRIYKGYIYYLYDLPGTADNKMLFRQRL